MQVSTTSFHYFYIWLCIEMKGNQLTLIGRPIYPKVDFLKGEQFDNKINEEWKSTTPSCFTISGRGWKQVPLGLCTTHIDRKIGSRREAAVHADKDPSPIRPADSAPSTVSDSSASRERSLWGTHTSPYMEEAKPEQPSWLSSSVKLTALYPRSMRVLTGGPWKFVFVTQKEDKYFYRGRNTRYKGS